MDDYMELVLKETSRPANITDHDFLMILNDREVALSIPVLCFITLLMVIGACGNILVLVTYAKRIQKSSTNLFIFCLALFDSVNCFFGLPLEIFSITSPYTNDNHYLCAFHKFFAFSADLASGYIIVCISFDRYLRIARPHQHGFGIGRARTAVVVIAASSLIICSFSLFIYGSETVMVSPSFNVLGHKCGVYDKAKETVLPIVFNTLILVVFSIGVIVLLTVYTRLGLKVRQWNRERYAKEKRNHYRRRLYVGALYSETEASSSKFEENSKAVADEKRQVNEKVVFSAIFSSDEKVVLQDEKEETSEREDTEGKEDTDDGLVAEEQALNKRQQEQTINKRPGYVRELSRSLDKSSFMKIEKEDMHVNGNRTLPHLKTVSLRRQDPVGKKVSKPTLAGLRRRITLSKTTIMFIAATVAFIACHLPYVLTKLAKIVYPNMIEDMSSVEYSLFKFAQFSFVVSYGVNPLIYSFLNPKFRRECKTLLIRFIKNVTCKGKAFGPS